MGVAEGTAGTAGVVGTTGAVETAGLLPPPPLPALRVMVRRVLEGATTGSATLVGFVGGVTTGASVPSAGSETVMKTPPGLETGDELGYTTEAGLEVCTYTLDGEPPMGLLAGAEGVAAG